MGRRGGTICEIHPEYHVFCTFLGIYDYEAVKMAARADPQAGHIAPQQAREQLKKRPPKMCPLTFKSWGLYLLRILCELEARKKKRRRIRLGRISIVRYKNPKAGFLSTMPRLRRPPTGGFLRRKNRWADLG